MKQGEVKKAVFLPINLYDRLSERVQTTEFGSVEEYVAYVMETILRVEDFAAEEPVLSRKEEEEVKKRLRALGYLE